MTTPVAVRLVPVTLASGQRLEVQGAEEAGFFDDTRDKYLAENRFTDVTDLQDLDNLLIMELMVHRWSLWTASGKDYDGNVIDEDAYIKPLREYSQHEPFSSRNRRAAGTRCTGTDRRVAARY